MPAFSATASRPSCVRAARPATGRTQAHKNKFAATMLAGAAAVTLMASPAQAGIFDNIPGVGDNPAQDAKQNILKGEEKAKEALPKAPPPSKAGPVVGGIEKKIEQATAPSRSAAFSVPEQEEGARKYKGSKPNLNDRFQSGGSGGAGPEAGKPKGKLIIE